MHSDATTPPQALLTVEILGNVMQEGCEREWRARERCAGQWSIWQGVTGREVLRGDAFPGVLRQPLREPPLPHHIWHPQIR